MGVSGCFIAWVGKFRWELLYKRSGSTRPPQTKKIDLSIWFWCFHFSAEHNEHCLKRVKNKVVDVAYFCNNHSLPNSTKFMVTNELRNWDGSILSCMIKYRLDWIYSAFTLKEGSLLFIQGAWLRCPPMKTWQQTLQWLGSSVVGPTFACIKASFIWVTMSQFWFQPLRLECCK